MPELRLPQTCAALAALAERRWVEDEAAAELTAGLPRPARARASAADGGRPADPGPARARAGVREVRGLRRVRRRRRSSSSWCSRPCSPSSATTPRCSSASPISAPARSLVFTGTGDDPETLKTLADMGFKDPSAISARIRAWHHGHIRATRSDPGARAADRADAGAAATSLREQPDRDAAFRLFDEFVTGLPAGRAAVLAVAGQPAACSSLLADLMGDGAPPGAPPERQCRPVRRHARAGFPRAPAGPGVAGGGAALAAGRRARPAGHAGHLPPLGARAAVPGGPAGAAGHRPTPRPRRACWPPSPRW